MVQAVSWVKGMFAKKRPDSIIHNLRSQYENFVKLLAENDQLLELISELQNRYHGKTIFTIPYLQNVVKKLLVGSQNIVRLLNELTDNKYLSLDLAHRQIEQEIRDVMTGVREPVVTFTAVLLSNVYREMADKVGDKMANLGEIQNRLNLPVPKGFATTVCAYSQFIEYNHLDFVISRMLEKVDENNTESLVEAEKAIKDVIQRASLPPELSYYLQKGYRELSREDEGCFVSFRSSALGEDGEASFAGQYTSLLNVSPSQLEEAYKAVVGSKYNARAIYYRRKRGYRDEDIAMSIGVLKMVKAVVAGVMYTEDPNNPERHNIIISAIWGLGQLLVDGQVASDTYIFDKNSEFRIVGRQIPAKRICLIPDQKGGVRKARVAKKYREIPCLNEFQLKVLLSYCRALENHYQWPQDIEWAIDKDGTIYILQSRPLSLSYSKPSSKVDFSKYSVLLEGGQTACGGMAVGPVFRYRTEHDFEVCPEGAILVVGRTSPRLVKVMNKVSGIVANLGSPTDHMSSLSREFQIPTLVNLRKATKRLPVGEKVILDASNGVVYGGIGNDSIELRKETKKPVVNIKTTEAYRLLERLMPLVSTLNLVDHKSQDFTAENCQSLHDIVRFAHEVSLNAMFDLGKKSGLKKKGLAFRLDSQIPLMIYVIDLEGNIVKKNNKDKIKPDQVNSDLFQAIWSGMTHKNVCWEKISLGQLDLKGFFSAMSQSMIDNLGTGQEMGDNYFILAQNYLNGSFRFGYHFATVDAYISHEMKDNFLSMTFKGGAAPQERRARRAKFISSILKQIEFEVTQKGDFVKARIKYGDYEECLEKLDVLGRLIGCSRLLDMALTSDRLLDIYIQRFNEGDYSLGIMK